METYFPIWKELIAHFFNHKASPLRPTAGKYSGKPARRCSYIPRIARISAVFGILILWSPGSFPAIAGQTDASMKPKPIPLESLSSATQPSILDHNRMIVAIEFSRPDGTVRKARAWVDTGSQYLTLSEPLACDLGFDTSGLKGGKQSVELNAPAPPIDKEICSRFYSPFYENDRQTYAIVESRIIGRYGNYRSSTVKGHKHSGIDLRGKYGEPVYAIGAGVVEGIFRGFPNRTVIVKHYLVDGDSVYSEYTHIEEVTVRTGERVDQNTCLGRIFNAEELQRSNFNAVSHLHLEFRKSLADSGKASWQSLTMAELDKYCLDPEAFLPQYMK